MGKLSVAKTGYELWLDREGLPVTEGHGVEDIKAIPRGRWDRLGGSGAYVSLDGMFGTTGMYVAEIPPGASLEPERHLYQEIVYILDGQGATEVWQEGKPKQTFEWNEGSLFAPPLNAWHRLHNGSNRPALFLGMTDAPVVFDLFRDPGFVMDCDVTFAERFNGEDSYFSESEQRSLSASGWMVWETNFVSDARSALLDAAEFKAAGGRLTQFEISGNSLIGHVSEWPAGRYHKAHYHAAGAVLLGLRSEGYVLMWPNQIGPRPFESGHGDEVVRIEWGVGSVYSPPLGWFHQHFNTGKEPARHLALRFGSRKHPVGFHLAGKRMESATSMSIRDGGTLIDYEDEDPEIRRMFERALAERGVPCEMPEFAPR
jgi:mannose-6-phosphate isomerase-like protein (cupin superfamily)/oxalate decarboxylase/phosphoglucose isomerase-like protein (cupin superfamily)